MDCRQSLFQCVEVLYMRSDSSSNVAVYDTATMFMVPRAYSYGLGARFNLVYDPGRHWTWRWGNAR
jgi:hypothetical protein